MLEDIKSAQRAYSNKSAEYCAVCKSIDELKVVDPIVTEHAILRYLERTMDLDMDEIKNKILSESTVEQIKILGNGKYPIGGGRKVVVKDMTAISVI